MKDELVVTFLAIVFAVVFTVGALQVSQHYLVPLAEMYSQERK